MKRSMSWSIAAWTIVAGERVVDLEQRERELVEVRDPADDRGQVDHVAAAVERALSDLELAQIAFEHLAALRHPVRRRPVVGDADLEARVAQQAADDGRADRPGPAGDQHPGHRRPRRPGSDGSAAPSVWAAAEAPLRRPESSRASAA